jgi:phage-related protein
VGSSKKDLKAMPEEVQDAIGYALDLAQHGKMADDARPMHGDLSDVIEIRADDERGDRTFRAAYTVKLGSTVYVLHAFQKKSKKGIATTKRDLDLIRERLRQAREHYEQQA